MKTDFTATDIIQLIKACRKQGVCDFSLGELKLSFGAPKDKGTPTLPNPAPSEKEEDELLLQKECELKQEKLEELRLSDPLAYEEMIMMDNDNPREEQSLGTQ